MRKTAIIEKIVEVVKDGRITGISDVRDESDRDGMRLVIELKKGEDPQVIVNQLFQYTPLQQTVSIINLAIDARQPRTLTLRGLLDAYIKHRKDVIRRRTLFLLRKAEERKHIVEGLRIAVDNIDEVIRIIRASANRDQAKDNLSAAFGLSRARAQAIVDMRLGSLTGLEREKLEEEFQALIAEIADLNDILARDERVVEIIRADLDDIEKRYGDDAPHRDLRGGDRGQLRHRGADHRGDDGRHRLAGRLHQARAARRLPRARPRRARDQGLGSEGRRRAEVALRGRDARLPAVLLQQGQGVLAQGLQGARGLAHVQGPRDANLLPLEDGEEITNVLRVPAFDAESSVFFATRGGTVKKTKLEKYSRPKKGGIKAILLDEGDAVVGVRLAQPGDTIVLCTRTARRSASTRRPRARWGARRTACAASDCAETTR